METRFIVDSNAGKLARWLRIMGYDTLFFNNIDDAQLVDIALREGRVALTKDTQLMRRRVVANGQLRGILLQDDDPKEQLRQVIGELKLDCQLRQFTRCLECNQNLAPKTREEVKEVVPPYVFRTQTQYMQCPSCLRVYWRGTHWQRMKRELEKIAGLSERG
ncbi:MAG TPA: Mut7-C RNAse domain-containing protein [Dehalococcoidia bacterium]|nr:Mut7-C RNAse domain-containing protein [Dehalococcoidia bacterium]